jgi:hypothetical protein
MLKIFLKKSKIKFLFFKYLDLKQKGAKGEMQQCVKMNLELVIMGLVSNFGNVTHIYFLLTHRRCNT